jgi:hypothetical protein
MPTYSSVRAINSDAYKAKYGRLHGLQVFFAPQAGTKSRVIHARTRKGQLQVLHLNNEQYVNCTYAEIITSRA